MTDRAARIAGFLDRAGWGGAERRPLAGDASFRRYERLSGELGRAMLMDAPPPQEDVRPFIRIGNVLAGLGLSAPRILAEDTAAGLLLLEDLGDDTYTKVLGEGGDEAALYELALNTLVALHGRFDAGGSGDAAPAYDDSALLGEAMLLCDWYMPAVLGHETPRPARSEFSDLWRAAFTVAWRVPATLVLRDYHVDNLVWLRERDGVAACGLLDFQDARIGPVTYDLVSLLEDARRDVPAALSETLLRRYLAAFPIIDKGAFAASYAILGAQRSAKILGIFTRLSERDGKPGYLTHIPRVWRWLEGDLRHPALAGLRDWFDRELPAESRRIPG